MSTSQQVGRLILRLAIGGLLGFYGYHKLTLGGEGLASVSTWLANKGLPDLLKYGVYLGKVLAPTLLVAGLFTRLAGLVIAANMGFSLILAHAHDFGVLNEHGGWGIERPLTFLCGGLAIALLGPGSFSVDARRKKSGSKTS